jgi:hypothetical protein
MKLKFGINKKKKETVRREVLGEVRTFANQLVKMANLKQKLLIMSR